MIYPPFQDREQAGRLLASELASKIPVGIRAVVLALPRGGLPVAAPIAAQLNAPLDVVLVRKLGVPRQPELAFGALAESSRYLDENLVTQLGISRSEIESVVSAQEKEMERRCWLYRGSLPQPTLRGRIAVLVDDGLATGSTMLAAVRHVRGQSPERIIAVAPVASRQACDKLAAEVDQCLCLVIPKSFLAVGEWYIDFHQVSDAEARETLARYRDDLTNIKSESSQAGRGVVEPNPNCDLEKEHKPNV